MFLLLTNHRSQEVNVLLPAASIDATHASNGMCRSCRSPFTLNVRSSSFPDFLSDQVVQCMCG